MRAEDLWKVGTFDLIKMLVRLQRDMAHMNGEWIDNHQDQLRAYGDKVLLEMGMREELARRLRKAYGEEERKRDL